MRRTRRPDNIIRLHHICCRRLNCHTPYVAYSWSAKDPYQLGGRASVVANRNDIAERTVFAFSNGVKHIDKAVGSTASRENNYTWIHRHERGGYR